MMLVQTKNAPSGATDGASPILCRAVDRLVKHTTPAERFDIRVALVLLAANGLADREKARRLIHALSPGARQ
ncbi:MAG: hypothetical protein HZA24_07425 [Nitrospirae bacterium]|nr:hypothetical protein [Nitrospirota bacterium]